MATPDELLIGVDGGATEVRAHAVACDDPSHLARFRLMGPSAARCYPRLPDFAPLPTADQLAEREKGQVRPSTTESAQGRQWVQSAAEAIAEVARECGARWLRIGIGMPGLKTEDRRGIAVINNGPRIPDYLDQLERDLRDAGLSLASPIAALGSDADYCGLGEQYAADGLFRDVEGAYYVGGGTGLADALKLRGRLVPLDQAKSWIMKAWQMPSALGPTLERLASAASLNRICRDLTSNTADASAFPEQAARSGDTLAMACLDVAALALAELIFERLWTIKNGRPEAPHRGESYGRLSTEHEFRGVLLDRVIIGQRIGLIYADACSRTFADKLDGYLAVFIARSGDSKMAQAYLASLMTPAHIPQLKRGFVRASRLRAAPALGAAVAALLAAAGTPAPGI